MSYHLALKVRFYESRCVKWSSTIKCWLLHNSRGIGLPNLPLLLKVFWGSRAVCHWSCGGMCVYVWHCVASALVCLQLCAFVVTVRGPFLVNPSPSPPSSSSFGFFGFILLCFFCTYFKIVCLSLSLPTVAVLQHMVLWSFLIHI